MEVKHTICMEPGCQSNCWRAPGHFPFQLIMPPGNTSFEVVLNGLKGRFIGCGVCRHPYGDHQTGNQRWQEVFGTETFTDEETKRQFDNATTNADKKRVMRETVERKLADIQDDISNATEGVSALVEGYASLSLSGSFTSHIHTTIKLLNVNLETLRHDAAPQMTIEQMAQSIAALEEKLTLIETATRSRAKGKQTVRRGPPLFIRPGSKDRRASAMSISSVRGKVAELAGQLLPSVHSVVRSFHSRLTTTLNITDHKSTDL